MDRLCGIRGVFSSAMEMESVRDCLFDFVESTKRPPPPPSHSGVMARASALSEFVREGLAEGVEMWDDSMLYCMSCVVVVESRCYDHCRAIECRVLK